MPGLATPPPTGVAPLILPAGGLAIDGDLIANVQFTNVGDWIYLTNSPGGGGGVLSSTGVPINPATTFHFVDSYGNSGSDYVFAGGWKWTDNPNDWTWTINKASAKADLNNALLHIGSDTNSHVWVAVAADRFSTSGDSYIDFEFLQNTLVRTNNNRFVSSGPDGGRTINDLLLTLAFGGGGKVVDFTAWSWQTNGSGGFAYIDITAALPVGKVFAALNSNSIAAPYGAFGKTTYDANAFAEAAVDLTALLGNFDQCVSFGFKTIMIKTKASTASTATIEDFIDPIQYNLKIGPSAEPGPDQSVCIQGDQTAFVLNGKASSGLQPIVSTTWSIVDGQVTIDSPSSLITTALVSSASATLRLTVATANGCTETNDIVLHVISLPTCSISGPSQVCPRSTIQFSAPTGMAAYRWSVTGNAAISGPTNAQSVSIKAGDACNASYSLSLTVISNICSSTCSTDVLVNDTTPPSLVIPADISIQCPGSTTTNATGTATATDDCNVVAVSYADSVTNLCGGTKVIYRNWTASDLCGNATNAIQTITVYDIISPIITCPSDRVLECPADTGTNATGVATAQDGCSQTAITYSDSISNTCGGGMVIARRWLAVDLCGNQSSCIQKITLRDTTRPSLIIPTNVVLECPADTTTNNTGSAVATDTCSAVTLTYNDAVTNSCAGAKVINRTWTAIDDCGNATNRIQTITVRDTTRPTIACPPDLTLDCPADTSTNATGMATAQDACTDVTIRYTDVVSNYCGGTKIILRTWSAVDACSNSISCVQKITVRDITPPVITCPGDLTLECPAITSTNVTGVATATDGCGTVTISYTDLVNTNCPGTKVIARTWKAVDACGNISTCVQTITVRDTIKPIITCPANLVLDCPADTRTNVTGRASATDSCSAVAITYVDDIATNCGATKVISRVWTATDLCGNSSSCTQTITVRDITPPLITCPTNRVLDCPADTRTNVTGVATAQDGCSSVAITYSDSVSNSCGGTKLISRTWLATDACGNTASCVQTITVRDITPPIITCPTNLVLECPADTSTNATGVATAQDTCGSTSIRYNDVTTNGCGGTKIIYRTWTATDDCGNSASCLQTITVRDTTPPIITCPPNQVLECPAVTTTNATGVATATDGCGSVTIRFTDVVTNNCANTKIIARTWTATDACANSASCVQTITVLDTIKPTLALPPNVILECPITDTSTNITGSATAQDGCGLVTIRYVDSVTNGCGLTRVIARTWTATDACGNSTSGIQTITVRDTTPPVITCPTNRVLDCPADTSTNNTGMATAQDTCGSVSMRYSDVVTNNCGNTKIIARTWTATDACGNSASCVQTITVRDITKPALTLPPNLTLECGASTATNATGNATAQDACSAVAITYSDSVSNLCGGSKIISRTWLATDGCGNSISGVQTITVRDTTPPSMRLPADLVLQCPGDTRTNVTGVPITVDVCGAFTLVYSDIVSNGCGFTKTVQRLWTATDQCGNTTNGTQTITVVDTTKPSISCPRVSVQCVKDVPPPYANLTAFLAAGGSASDSCSSSLAFSQTSDSGLVGRCPGTVTRVYRVTDACGNFGECTQTITVDDTIAPVLTCPASVTVECGTSLDPANFGRATATDNCSTNVAIAYTDAAVQSQYDLKFYVADPDSGTGPYSPTYLKFAPGSLPCPDSAQLTGRALDPLRNAVAFSTTGQLDALTSIGNVPMAFGQIVPYEVVIQPSGGPGPERGTIEFTANWSTFTTSNNRFGYDTNYMVYCAFVDAADPGSIDPNANARVESYSSKVVNQGTIDEAIQGTFRVSGLDSGDRVVVEIWVVLMPNMPDHSGGTVAASLVSAQTAANPPAQITVGVQTDSLGNLSKISALPAPQEQPPLGPLPPQPPVLPGATVSVINRTWTATDDCGNQSSCVQQLTVRDTTPPAITAPPDLALECPATDTSTNITGMPTVQDGCGTVKLFYTDVVSNGCGLSKVISRTWTAIDQAGNSTNVLQIISVRDTTAPTIICKPDRTIQPGAGWAFEDPSVSDTCSAVILQVLSTTTNNTGTNAIVATRTWQAMDACGNASSCQQTITIQLGTAPIITSQPANIGAPYLGSASMSVGASGTGPLFYQWRKNGVMVPGATSNLLNMANLQFTNAGLYCVVVSNAAGAVVSSNAVLNVAPRLDGQSVSNMLKLTWPAPMVLQMATNVPGPYFDVPGAVSPYYYSTTNKQTFFRLRSPAFSLLSASLPGGQFQITCPGVAGCNFIVQGSTNLVNWVNLQTNTSPFTFVDSNAWQYPARFYRAILAH